MFAKQGSLISGWCMSATSIERYERLVKIFEGHQDEGVGFIDDGGVEAGEVDLGGCLAANAWEFRILDSLSSSILIHIGGGYSLLREEDGFFQS